MEDNQLILLEGEIRPVPAVPAGFYAGKLRPSRSAEEILMAVAKKLMPDLMRWGRFEEDEAPEIAEQLLKALKWERDGYKLAKHLEDHCSWDGDAELVDLLEGADFYGCHRDAIKAWIRDNAIAPAFEVGKQVTVKLRGDGDLTGTIRDTTDDGMYTVMIPAKGHVESGLGTHGLLFTWEDVEAWNTVAETV